jgi:hypothetical protein
MTVEARSRPMFIYKLTNKTNGKIYVGLSSRDDNTRWKEHIQDSRKRKPKAVIDRAIKKHGEENFTLKILERVPSDEGLQVLGELEMFWIRKLKSFEKKIGYNVALGSYSNAGYTRSKKTIRSSQLKGKSAVWQYSLDGKFVRSFFSVSEAARSLKTAAGNIFRVLRKGSGSSGGFQWRRAQGSPQARITAHVSRPKDTRTRIYCFDKSGKQIAYYPSMPIAASETGLTLQSISDAARGIRFSAGGFAWSRQSQLTKKVLALLKKPIGGARKKRAVSIFNSKGKRIGTFGSVGEAARAVGVETTIVSSNCKGQRDGAKSKSGEVVRFRYADGKAVKVLPQHGRLRGHKRQVAQYDSQGRRVEIHQSVTDAATSIGKRTRTLGNALMKKHTCGGYRWHYDDEDAPAPKKLTALKKQTLICQYDYHGKLINTFKSASAAARAHKATTGTISKASKGKLYTAVGFFWRSFPVDDVPKSIKITRHKTEGMGLLKSFKGKRR